MVILPWFTYHLTPMTALGLSSYRNGIFLSLISLCVMGEIRKYLLWCERLDYSFNGMYFFAWQNLFWLKAGKLETFSTVLSNQLDLNMYCENKDQVDNNFRKFRTKANKSEPVGRLAVVYKKNFHTSACTNLIVWSKMPIF